MTGDSPDMPETISGAETRRKGTPQWLAMALARAVFPQPGGPCSRTPRGGSTPSQAYTYATAVTISNVIVVVIITRLSFPNRYCHRHYRVATNCNDHHDLLEFVMILTFGMVYCFFGLTASFSQSVLPWCDVSTCTPASPQYSSA